MTMMKTVEDEDDVDECDGDDEATTVTQATMKTMTITSEDGDTMTEQRRRRHGTSDGTKMTMVKKTTTGDAMMTGDS